ncbi:hypothetical protein AAHE18_13G135200 [Arachis hypogaea]
MNNIVQTLIAYTIRIKSQEKQKSTKSLARMIRHTTVKKKKAMVTSVRRTLEDIIIKLVVINSKILIKFSNTVLKYFVTLTQSKFSRSTILLQLIMAWQRFATY